MMEFLHLLYLKVSNSQDVFVINKSPNYIGIVTQRWFNNFNRISILLVIQRLVQIVLNIILKSNFDQINGTLERIHSQVSSFNST